MPFSRRHADLMGLFRDILLASGATPQEIQDAVFLAAYLESSLPRMWGLLLEAALLGGVAAGHLPPQQRIRRFRILAQSLAPMSACSAVGAAVGILLDQPVVHLHDAASLLGGLFTGRANSCWIRTLMACVVAHGSRSAWRRAPSPALPAPVKGGP